MAYELRFHVIQVVLVWLPLLVHSRRPVDTPAEQLQFPEDCGFSTDRSACADTPELSRPFGKSSSSETLFLSSNKSGNSERQWFSGREGSTTVSMAYELRFHVIQVVLVWLPLVVHSRRPVDTPAEQLQFPEDCGFSTDPSACADTPELSRPFGKSSSSETSFLSSNKSGNSERQWFSGREGSTTVAMAYELRFHVIQVVLVWLPLVVHSRRPVDTPAEQLQRSCFLLDNLAVLHLKAMRSRRCRLLWPTSRQPSRACSVALSPQWESEITLHVFQGAKEQRGDMFVVETFNNSVSITGSSGVAVATGLYYYLKKFCNVHVSWSGSQTKTATGKPPLVPEPIVINLNGRFRYYQNVCTASYSTVWWNWTRWEQEIDWMALNGINLPLAFTGQEEIWKRTFLKLGVKQAEIDEFFSGPAFLAWQRMGNFRGFGGPLPESWHVQQVQLQHRILKRMREFGMMPVLPAFAGHVPRAVEKLFPNTSMSRTCWQAFEERYACPTFIFPNETLFVTIGKLFLQQYIAEFGTDHYYNTDLFNEINPPSGNTSFVQDSGKAVFTALTEVDPEAVWVMQGWLFINDPFYWTSQRAKALLTSVPQGRLLILDLSSERQPVYEKVVHVLWPAFHLEHATQLRRRSGNGPFNASKANDSTMVGTGLTPEGINQNDVMFEFMNENAWRSSPVNISEWIENYALRRYGKENVNATSAWRHLCSETLWLWLGIESVYDLDPSTLVKDHGQYALVVRPSLHLKNKTWYDPDHVYTAWWDLVNAAKDPELAEQGTFRYDLVDVTRQSLQLLIYDGYVRLRRCFWKKMKEDFRRLAVLMTDMFNDLDTLLTSDPHFLLGTWLRDARSWGDNRRDLYEYNARNQITIWGPKGEIRDYAAKQWSGLVRSYYMPRWELFLKSLWRSLEQHVPFNQTLFDEEVFKQVEEPFTFQRNTYPTSPQGDSIAICTELQRKYRTLLFQNQ
ncbi:hypothetical protein MRX96_036515 [Rhipicephalus microplus]